MALCVDSILDARWCMMLRRRPKGKTLSAMRKLRNKSQDTEAVGNAEMIEEEEPVLANDDGTISGEVYGARLSSLLKEVDPNFELEPEAEELVLRMVDDFVDRVTRRAAEYAKHRKSQTLDAVDLQFCLERDWGIIIPGLPSQRPAQPSWAYRRPHLDGGDKKTKSSSKKRKASSAPAPSAASAPAPAVAAL